MRKSRESLYAKVSCYYCLLTYWSVSQEHVRWWVLVKLICWELDLCCIGSVEHSPFIRKGYGLFSLTNQIERIKRKRFTMQKESNLTADSNICSILLTLVNHHGNCGLPSTLITLTQSKWIKSLFCCKVRQLIMRNLAWPLFILPMSVLDRKQQNLLPAWLSFP